MLLNQSVQAPESRRAKGSYCVLGKRVGTEDSDDSLRVSSEHQKAGSSRTFAATDDSPLVHERVVGSFGGGCAGKQLLAGVSGVLTGV